VERPVNNEEFHKSSRESKSAACSGQGQSARKLRARKVRKLSARKRWARGRTGMGFVAKCKKSGKREEKKGSDQDDAKIGDRG